MRQRYKVIVIILALVVVCALGREYAIRKSTPAASIKVDEMTPLSLELVYCGEKPDGMSSVQSMAVTEDYFVVAGRPFGTVEQGGETNNKLVIVDRDELRDVSQKFFNRNRTYEFGHANGMCYNPNERLLTVVGVRNSDGYCDGFVGLSADDFKVSDSGTLPCYGNGIAYDGDSDTYIVRNESNISVLDSALANRIGDFEVSTNLTNQDIGYFNGRVYLVNWAYHRNDARAVGIRVNENVIYQVDVRSGEILQAFVVREPRMEMESIDFIDGEAYVLFNGGGGRHGCFYIYRIDFEEKDLG